MRKEKKIRFFTCNQATEDGVYFEFVDESMHHSVEITEFCCHYFSAKFRENNVFTNKLAVN